MKQMTDEIAELLQGILTVALLSVDDLATALRLLDEAGWVPDGEKGWTRRT
jgi:hypothetical protein